MGVLIMASISTESSGRRVVQFVSADGKRRSIRLGKVSMKQAQAVKVKVEDLVHAAFTGHVPSDETSRWLVSLDQALHARLAAVGLVKVRESVFLGAFIDAYIAQRSDVKPSTKLVYKRARNHLVRHFGEGRSIQTITPGDADAWRLKMREKGLAENTICKSTSVAQQWFKNAIRSKLILENPFTGLPSNVKGNREKFHFVSQADAQRVIDACPDAQWRLLFALARFGGLRVPSEALRLRWQDVNWVTSRFVVTSPKTERYQGHESREVPIFPELLPWLREAFELASPGDERCISRYPVETENLGMQLSRIIKRAGLKPWPKLWQNLRSTRETELIDEGHSIKAVVDWIGNSVPVAMKHYLQVTEAHFQRAIQGRGAVQNPVQQAAAPSCTVMHAVRAETVSVERAAPCINKQPPAEAEGCSRWAMRDRNTPHQTPKKTAYSETGGAESGAVADSDLHQLIQFWPWLTPAERSAVLSAVQPAFERLGAVLRPLAGQGGRHGH